MSAILKSINSIKNELDYHWKKTADVKTDKTGRQIPKGHVIFGTNKGVYDKDPVSPASINKSTATAQHNKRVKGKSKKVSNTDKNDKETTESLSFSELHAQLHNEVGVHISVESFVEEHNENNKSQMFWKPISENTAVIRIKEGKELLSSLGIEGKEVVGEHQVESSIFSIRQIDFKGSSIYEAFVFNGNLEVLEADESFDVDEFKQESINEGFENANPNNQ